MTPDSILRHALLILVAPLPLAAQSPSPAVQVSARPSAPVIELTSAGQDVGTDLVIVNQTTDTLELARIQVTVRNGRGELVLQKEVGHNGETIRSVPDRTVLPGGRLLVFNPLYAFPRDLEIGSVRFDLWFDAGGVEEKHTAFVEISPRPAAEAIALMLPLEGRILNHDGHDFFTHHRRVDWMGPMADLLKITVNPTRYAYDLVVVDSAGRMFTGDGTRNSDWFGFGATVTAPGDGVVVEAVGDQPDHRKGEPPGYTREEVIENPSLLQGNYVAIKHAGGIVSFVCHLRQGSVKVSVGERVRAGQTLGAVGFSGDAYLVHVHLDVRMGPGVTEGYPSRFTRFEKLRGARWSSVGVGALETGDIVRRASRH